jgi:AcrR family transcriptional regulator
MNSSKDIIKGINHPKTQLGMSKMNRLVECAEKLFAKHGFYATSISDICKEAKTAVGTFYIYFDTKTDIYRFLMERYKKDIKHHISENIGALSDRYSIEREGIKCFIKFAVENPNVYNIIWGSLSIDRKMFTDYYVSFADSYVRALEKSRAEVNTKDTSAIAYMLMGISNFLGLKAIFENMGPGDIDKMMDEAVMPMLASGVFKKPEADNNC